MINIRNMSEKECVVGMEVFGICMEQTKYEKKKIVGMVGDIVCLDMKTELGYSMDSTKVLVHTVHMPFIDRGITFIYLLKV